MILNYHEISVCQVFDYIILEKILLLDLRLDPSKIQQNAEIKFDVTLDLGELRVRDMGDSIKLRPIREDPSPYRQRSLLADSAHLTG